MEIQDFIRTLSDLSHAYNILEAELSDVAFSQVFSPITEHINEVTGEFVEAITEELSENGKEYNVSSETETPVKVTDLFDEIDNSGIRDEIIDEINDGIARNWTDIINNIFMNED